MTIQPGRLKQILVKRCRLGPMDERDTAELVEGRGLRGNANQGGRRQVTLLDLDAWEEMLNELGASAPPSARRANLLLQGISLLDSRGRLLRVGDALLLIHGETRPCERMEAAHPGLRRALQPDWRGGAYAEVVRGGSIRVGDIVGWVQDPGC